MYSHIHGKLPTSASHLFLHSINHQCNFLFLSACSYPSTISLQIRIEMTKERAMALKGQEERLGAMIAAMQVDKAREVHTNSYFLYYGPHPFIHQLLSTKLDVIIMYASDDQTVHVLNVSTLCVCLDDENRRAAESHQHTQGQNDGWPQWAWRSLHTRVWAHSSGPQRGRRTRESWSENPLYVMSFTDTIDHVFVLWVWWKRVFCECVF